MAVKKFVPSYDYNAAASDWMFNLMANRFETDECHEEKGEEFVGNYFRGITKIGIYHLIDCTVEFIDSRPIVSIYSGKDNKDYIANIQSRLEEILGINLQEARD